MANGKDGESWDALRDEVLRLIDAGEYEAAIHVLEEAAVGETINGRDALLGLAQGLA